MAHLRERFDGKIVMEIRLHDGSDRWRVAVNNRAEVSGQRGVVVSKNNACDKFLHLEFQQRFGRWLIGSEINRHCLQERG